MYCFHEIFIIHNLQFENTTFMKVKKMKITEEPKKNRAGAFPSFQYQRTDSSQVYIFKSSKSRNLVSLKIEFYSK